MVEEEGNPYDSKVPSPIKKLALGMIISSLKDIFYESYVKHDSERERNKELALLYLQGHLDKKVFLPMSTVLDILSLPRSVCYRFRHMSLHEMEVIYQKLLIP